MDPTIRPVNALLLIKVQSEEGTMETPDPATDAVPFEADSVSFQTPYTTEGTNEVTGSLVASTPLVIGRASPFSFRSRIKGAGAGSTYSSSVKPPLHAALLGCGMKGYFQAAISAAALTAGAATTGTLGTGFSTTAQDYRGMPLILSGSSAPGEGHHPFVLDYTTGKVATLTETFDPALSTDTQAAIPANWTYAGTSPRDLTERGTDHPAVTIWYYEDGNLYKWRDCRGVPDLEGQNARPGYGTFNFTGVYEGAEEAAIPNDAVVAKHSAPLLVQGSHASGAALIGRVPLPISRWAVRNGGNVETPDDPNTRFGFGAGQIVGRVPMFEADPLRTLVDTRDAIAQIGAQQTTPIALRFGATAGNRWGLVMPQAQPVAADNAMRGSLRADAMSWQGLNPGRDAQGRDGELILTFY